mmetsp:Transcript_71607/g.154517  ORF Transcript_71607/g.154517 Transcript_71607/m.154517 type:complete len:253 (+) Transcript_71607:43-801(+)
MTRTSSSWVMRQGMLRIIHVLPRSLGSSFMASDARLVWAMRVPSRRASSLPVHIVISAAVDFVDARSVTSSPCTSSSGHIVVVVSIRSRLQSRTSVRSVIVIAGLSDVWSSIASSPRLSDDAHVGRISEGRPPGSPESEGSPELLPPRELPPREPPAFLRAAALPRNSRRRRRRPKKVSRKGSRAANGRVLQGGHPKSAGTLAVRGSLGGASPSSRRTNAPLQVRTQGDALSELPDALVMAQACSVAAVAVV